MFEGNIDIKKAIIHIIRKEKGIESLIPSDYVIELDEAFKNLIIKHINNTLKDSKRLFGELKIGTDDKSVLKSTIKVFKDTNDFVKESQNIARVLKNAMRGTSAKSTSILVVEYSHGINPFFGLIKLNFTKNYQPKEELVGKKLKISVKVEENGFNDSQKLEKVALIGLKNKENIPGIYVQNQVNLIDTKDYFSILVLDKQQSDTSLYWKEFLNCEVNDEGKVKTQKMVQFLSKKINTVFGNNSKDVLQKRDRLVTELKKASEFELDITLKALFTDEQIEEVQKEINEKEIITEFNINQDFVEKKFNKDVWVIDDKITISGSTNELKETFIIEKTYDDGTMDILLKGVKKV